MKDIGNDQYVQVESQVGRISNEFTARNEIGLDVGKQFGNGNLYTRFAAGHAFTGNVKTTYASGNAVKLTEQDLKGTWTELAFGGRYGFNTNNSVYADVTTGLSGDYQADWGVNAGFTHKF